MNVNWRQAVTNAGHAPSIHNTQPWRFVVSGDTVQLRADRTRAVPVIDPVGRQLAVSCGAALEYLCLTLAAAGWETEVVLDGPEDPDLFAIVRVTGPQPPDRDAANLVAAMPRRATVRAPFEPTPVPAEVVDDLGIEVRSTGAWFRGVTDRDDLITLTVLLQHAHEAQLTDPAYREEVASWRHRATRSDGIPDQAAPDLGVRHSNYALRDFNDGFEHDVVSLDDAPVDEHPLIAVVGTTGDGVVDWLTAGRGIARLLLHAARLGIAASPLNQVIDDPAPRRQLQAHLGLVGYPQMVLRLGYAEMVPTTGRRPVDDYLTVTE